MARRYTSVFECLSQNRNQIWRYQHDEYGLGSCGCHLVAPHGGTDFGTTVIKLRASALTWMVLFKGWASGSE
ncbi:MAG: hypothetical protein CM15mP84_09420 [Cellvibrionales bacterium]|nr:MAG: hypothetical protein CM15mP84_09420 [Cellvibrionales bacterium]